jgi:predicted nucleic acid-binding protein
MAAVVVDASAIVRLLGIGAEDDRFARVFTPDHERHAPELVDVEVVAAIRHALLASIVDERRAAAMVADHLRAPIRRHRHLTLIGRAYEWRRNVSVADGIYLALAERLGVPLVTADLRLRRAAHQLTQVSVLP